LNKIKSAADRSSKSTQGIVQVNKALEEAGGDVLKYSEKIAKELELTKQQLKECENKLAAVEQDADDLRYELNKTQLQLVSAHDMRKDEVSLNVELHTDELNKVKKELYEVKKARDELNNEICRLKVELERSNTQSTRSHVQISSKVMFNKCACVRVCI
jgi:chromosome segregation ATPase